jgi:CheY-like chemotaxis protein
LIVDDNMFNLIPLELILKEMFQITVDKALNGQEAVNMFQKNLVKKCCNVRYKLVLMDLNMPIMDGYDATALIIQQFKKVYPDEKYPNNDSLYVVAVTAFVNDENIRNCYKVGMVEVLHKPVNCEALGSVID